MSKREVKLYLEDIREATIKIEKYVGNKTFDEFMGMDMAVDAVVRNLSIIGEAARNLPDDFKDKHKHISWYEINGMRNKVIHEYSGINARILWKTIKEDILELKKQILEILNEI